MKANDLVGKKAIRNKPTSIRDDHSYMKKSIIIKKISDTQIVYTRVGWDGFEGRMDDDFLDDNWEEYHVDRRAGYYLERDETGLCVYRCVSGCAVPAGRGVVWGRD